MSKHFELLQQMEREQSFVSASNSDTVLPSQGKQMRSDDRGRWSHDEALRLVQQVFLLQSKEPPQVVVFAGIDHGNGCSQLCASVAEILSRNARRSVCLVEGNFRTPSLPALFGTENHHGLTEALLQHGPVSSFAKPTQDDNLWLLSSGSLATDSPSLLSSVRLQERILELREEFGFVLVDAPPLTKYSDAIAISQLSDGLVLIVEADSTRKEAASAAVTNLRSMNIPILAAVLNKRSFPIPRVLYNRL